MDSGAADSVARLSVLSQVLMISSNVSASGQRYLTANGTLQLPNLGEKTLNLLTNDI